MFVFFKQKTAYEMRISDWSSDVCSSDLAVAHLEQAGESGRGLDHIVVRGLAGVAAMAAVADRSGVDDPGVELPHGLEGEAELDRKSVVLGKSGSVRVDLGGRSIIKKKK